MFQYGDVLFGDCDPSAGHEQTKRRPLIVVSNDTFNAHSNLTFVVPVTSTDNGYALHVDIGLIEGEDGSLISGFACVEQAKALDLHARHGYRVGAVSDGVMESITALLLASLLREGQVVS